MTVEEVIRHLECIKIAEQIDAKIGTPNIAAIDIAIQALEKLRHLKDRPCEVCKCHTEYGCSKWSCVFEEEVKEK